MGGSVADGLDSARVLDEEFRRACARSQCDEPWVGGFSIAVGPKLREYRVGRERRADLRVIAWQHPYARAFFEGSPGGTFRLDRDESDGFASIDGRLDRRLRVASKERVLRRIEIESTAGRAVYLREGADFVDEAEQHLERAAEHGLPDVLALLTAEQYRLITAARSRAVIIQGRAGSGKTTVALHRVAWLTHPDATEEEAPVDPKRVLVVMFNRALSAFVETSLAPLGLREVQLHTFHAWALEAIRKAYAGDIAPSTTRLEGRKTAAALKRQLGMLTAIEAFVKRQTAALFAWLGEKVKPYRGEAWVELLGGGEGPIVPRLVALRRQIAVARDVAKTARERSRIEQVLVLFRTAKERMTFYKEELLRLLTDEALLHQHLDATGAELQLLADYQRALQGEGGSDRRPGPHVAFEDFALLLRLIQLKHGGLADKAADDVFLFDHLVVDEAQDFGAAELASLFSAVRSRTGVTIVGDLNQRIIPDADFIGWEALAKELGLDGAEAAKLEVAHRSTKNIVALAGSILPDGVASGRSGAVPTLTLVEHRAGLVGQVAELARAAMRDIAGAHVCIVCGSHAAASALRDELAGSMPGVDVRIGHNAAFTFAPGVTVTSLLQVKGLEFEAVIVTEPDEATYPQTDQGRRWLYTVATRAKERLAFVASSAVTPLLDAAREAGLVEVDDVAEVVPVQLGVGDDEPF